ncbi:hypothetical protein PBS_12580 [Paraburkholderia sp. 2C]
MVGYYNRFDVFSLTVDRERHEPVSWRTPAHAAVPQPVAEPVLIID